MNIKLTRIFPLLAALLFVGGCAMTPQMRIQHNPEAYAALSESHRALVQQGKIAKGMTREAVYLAWGRATAIKESSSGRETWLFATYYPVYTSGYWGGGPYCYGHGYHYWGPRVAYYEGYIARKVVFENGRVSYWERTHR